MYFKSCLKSQEEEPTKEPTPTQRHQIKKQTQGSTNKKK
jgi:hypothetical protein